MAPINFEPTINCVQGPWRALSPWPIFDAGPLATIAGALNNPATQRILASLEFERQYPHGVRQTLHALGLSRFFVDPAVCRVEDRGQPKSWHGETVATFPHVAALTMMSTAASASLGVTVGVNLLALLPLYIGADAEQLAWMAERVERGAFGCLLLTELPHGSDLLTNETTAEPGTLDAAGQFIARQPTGVAETLEPATHYRINGRKDLINGGSQHELLVIFARTRHATDGQHQPEAGWANPFAARQQFSLFAVERDGSSAIQAGAPERWHTLPVPAADISSVCFHDLVTPVAQRIGKEGQGFDLTQTTLSLSRGGVSAFAVGASSRAIQLATSYAQRRQLYGQPILHLGAITDHVLHMRALELLVAVMSLKAIAVINCHGMGAAHYAAVAKYACCTLGEELVAEGRYLHGSRALLLDDPYHRVIGDMLLFGTFDGTSHLVLDQIQWRLAQVAALSGQDGWQSWQEIRRVYATAPQPLSQMTRLRAKTLLIQPTVYLHALSPKTMWLSPTPLIHISEILLALAHHCRTAGAWGQDQGLRFACGRLFAWVETLIALIELADPDARLALGLGNQRQVPSLLKPLVCYTYGWFAGRLSAELRRLVHRTAWRSDLTRLDMADALLGRVSQSGRNTLRENSPWLTENFSWS
jgi:alkylation response protein AidB-like acyl-CoA dehydrogenase